MNSRDIQNVSLHSELNFELNFGNSMPWNLLLRRKKSKVRLYSRHFDRKILTVCIGAWCNLAITELEVEIDHWYSQFKGCLELTAARKGLSFAEHLGITFLIESPFIQYTRKNFPLSMNGSLALQPNLFRCNFITTCHVRMIRCHDMGCEIGIIGNSRFICLKDGHHGKHSRLHNTRTLLFVMKHDRKHAYTVSHYTSQCL